MARTGPVKTPAIGAQRYTQGVQQGGARWQQGIQATQLNPMALAAAQVAKALQNYAGRLNDNGPNGWVARLNATPVSFWKSQAGSAAALQKYAMASGSQKWQNWYGQFGQAMAQTMRDQAQTDRANGVPWQQRVINALNIAVARRERGV